MDGPNCTQTVKNQSNDKKWCQRYTDSLRLPGLTQCTWKACERRTKSQPEQKKPARFNRMLHCIQKAAKISTNWIRWQIVRGKRYLLWETNPEVLSRWAQSIIETEILLREVTQHENFVKECIQIMNANSDPVAKSILPDMVEELISLDYEYTRLERTYETVVAGCPTGPIKSGYLWIRNQPYWHLKSEWLRQDCVNRGGCCGRPCRCCEKSPDPRRRKGWGHCTAQCACCKSISGFRCTEREKRLRQPDYDLTVHPWSPYSRQMFRAYIWSLDWCISWLVALDPMGWSLFTSFADLYCFLYQSTIIPFII